ncbi:vWA domain-containing protein [Candidatus Methylopumilus planktonicus]|uniref:vWA domain-containing protein n=1 Tax=Candidatus Methylopumilus planktonicus TaxID=1581557 RepID=UPI00111E4934|nr:vWA domain-containing protein [Candidatus Methylopumilus planktonicus]QDD00205.1 VWA domain-containing protein [Candidatus Methylopumilus planktonicus]
MKEWLKTIQSRSNLDLDTLSLILSIVLIVLAIINPSIPLKHNIYNYVFVADISQSMNTIDMSAMNKPLTRLEHMKHSLHEIMSELPCGTKVSIGIFVGVSVSASYTPIEICENFDAIEDTIDHLDWRSGWSGNSRIRESFFNLARLIRSFPENSQVVYFTDGEEAPKLHTFNTRDLGQFQGGNDWIIVGVGSLKGAPIPKLDGKNQLIGYWSSDSFGLQPGIAQISEANLGTRDNLVAGGESDRYISKLDEAYLKDITKQIDGIYVRGDSVLNILSAMKKQKPAWQDTADFHLKWFFASLAGIIFSLRFISIKHIKQYVIKRRK